MATFNINKMLVLKLTVQSVIRPLVHLLGARHKTVKVSSKTHCTNKPKY